MNTRVANVLLFALETDVFLIGVEVVSFKTGPIVYDSVGSKSLNWSYGTL